MCIRDRYYSRLTLDFATNKRIADDVAIIPSKRLRNKIAGFTTVRFHLATTTRDGGRRDGRGADDLGPNSR